MGRWRSVFSAAITSWFGLKAKQYWLEPLDLSTSFPFNQRLTLILDDIVLFTFFVVAIWVPRPSSSSAPFYSRPRVETKWLLGGLPWKVWVVSTFSSQIGESLDLNYKFWFPNQLIGGVSQGSSIQCHHRSLYCPVIAHDKFDFASSWFSLLFCWNLSKFDGSNCEIPQVDYEHWQQNVDFWLLTSLWHIWSVGCIACLVHILTIIVDIPERLVYSTLTTYNKCSPTTRAHSQTVIICHNHRYHQIFPSSNPFHTNDQGQFWLSGYPLPDVSARWW